jgi:hypothetical protein
VGHHHLLRIARTREWLEVIALITGDGTVEDIAAATSKAAERSMIDAAADPGVRYAFWLLTQIPLAARKQDFAGELRILGLEVSSHPSLVEIAAATMDALDREVSRSRGRSDYGELAQLSAAESLHAVAGRELPDLLSSDSDRVRAALAGLATVNQFAVLSREFFARLTRRHLNYYLSRELSNHVGSERRFHSIREHRAFEEALDGHCREASRIIKEFSGQWFSKHNFEGGIDPAKAGRFVHVAAKKIRDELRHRRGADV